MPKFQAVQAAHEILSDPVEKGKYDAGRARLAAKNAAVASTYTSDPYSFPRPTNTKPVPKQPFPFPPPPKTPAQRPAFATPNQKTHTSSGADKFNAFTRGAPQSWDRSKFDEARAEAARAFPNMRPTSSGPPMPPPRSAGRAPTAPKPSPTPDIPHVPNIPPTSFPGLSRTASSRRTDYQGDPAQVPRSAFSYVSGARGRHHPMPHINVQEPYMRSPPVSRARPSVSPLRHTRSSDYDMRHDPGSRPSAKYAGGGGERIDLHGDGLHRSSSVRNSPIDDRGPFGRSSVRYENLPRHRSASPGMRKTDSKADFSESSSSSDEEPMHMNSRPKATPRNRPQMRTHLSYDTEKNPGLTAQYPSTNYTRIVDENRYQYPPPESREPTRKPFPDMSSPHVEKPGAFHGGESDKPKYASPMDSPWSQNRRERAAQRGCSFNGFPSWAVPSSVFPQTTPPKSSKRYSDLPNDNHEFVRLWDNRTDLSGSVASPQPNVQSTFSAAEWHDKLSAENIFRPDESLRKSPSKSTRTGSKSAPRARAQSRATDEPVSETTDGVDKSTAFQPGKLADDWASRASAKPKAARASPESESTTDSRDRYVVVEEDAMDVDPPPMNGHHTPTTNGVKHKTTTEPRSHQKRRSSHGGVDLKEFTQQAPFASTSAGLGGMKADLETHLPFESRAANDINLNRTKAARIRALNLPRPPKAVVPPAEDRIDKENFTLYVENMQSYMRDWNQFHAKMIEHFRSRQDRVCGTMSHNWIGQLSDGPEADALDEDEKGDKQAGYAAYLQWLKDDAQCRDWWEEANEKHLKCLEDLGRAREGAKKKLRPT